MKLAKHKWYVAIGKLNSRVGLRTTPNRAEQQYRQQGKVLLGPFKTKRAAVHFIENPQIPESATVAEIEEAAERLRRATTNPKGGKRQ